MWIGNGDNGKSELLELLKLSFGDYFKQIPLSMLVHDDPIQLKGVRLVVIPELRDTSVSTIKEFTCRQSDEKIFNFKPQFKMICCCNHLPSADQETWNHVKIVKFDSHFKDHPNPHNPHEFQKDPILTEKFIQWRETFMFILLEQYKVYKIHGLDLWKAWMPLLS